MITYKRALELLKSEEPVYYRDVRKRKITGVIWRRDSKSLYSSVELLDESMNCVSVVGLENIAECEEEIDKLDYSLALIRVDDLFEILQRLKTSILYEDMDMAKENYNKLLKGAIKLDGEINSLAEKIDNKKIIEMIEKNKKEEELGYEDLDFETIKLEEAALDKRIEEFDEDMVDFEEDL